MEEGIDSMDAFVAVTGIDELNILISKFAQSQNVPKVVAKVNRNQLADMANNLGLDSIISPKKSVSNVLARYARALENLKTSRAKSDFIATRAEEFKVPQDVNRCYFFNPFSVEILHKVMARILESWYEHPREILLLFYYPADEYIAWLMTVEELEFYDEIECDNLFEGNDPRERIMIFRLPGQEAEM